MSIASDSVQHDKQWAYRRGYSTELVLVHLTKMWRRALDSDSINFFQILGKALVVCRMRYH